MTHGMLCRSVVASAAPSTRWYAVWYRSQVVSDVAQRICTVRVARKQTPETTDVNPNHTDHFFFTELGLYYASS